MKYPRIAQLMGTGDQCQVTFLYDSNHILPKEMEEAIMEAAKKANKEKEKFFASSSTSEDFDYFARVEELVIEKFHNDPDRVKKITNEVDQIWLPKDNNHGLISDGEIEFDVQQRLISYGFEKLDSPYRHGYDMPPGSFVFYSRLGGDATFGIDEEGENIYMQVCFTPGTDGFVDFTNQDAVNVASNMKQISEQFIAWANEKYGVTTEKELSELLHHTGSREDQSKVYDEIHEWSKQNVK